MSDFYVTNLQADEVIVVGVVTTTNASSSNVSINGTSLAGSSTSSERKLGITNRRVIVEQAGAPEATIIVPNTDVRTVALKPETFVGRPRTRITHIITAAGETVALDMLMGDGDSEALLKQTFPGAEIMTEQEHKGWLAGLLDRIGLG